MQRRKAIGILLAGCIAPIMASRTAFARVLQGEPINPPDGPMRFSRTLHRDLADGRGLSVFRSFRVIFAPAEHGFTLSGSQESVHVDLPHELAAFAELERERDDSGMFPIALNAAGEITSGSSATPNSAQLAAAVSHALASIDQQGHAADERERLRQFAMALHDGGGRMTAHMPMDLFAPTNELHEETQNLVLDEGHIGLVRSRFIGEADPVTRLMRAASREIITEMGDNRRVTREEWQLAPLPQM